MNDLIIRLKRKYFNRNGTRKIEVKLAGTEPTNRFVLIKDVFGALSKGKLLFFLIFIGGALIFLGVLLSNYLAIQTTQLISEEPWVKSNIPINQSVTLIMVTSTNNELSYVNSLCLVSLTGQDYNKAVIINPLLTTTVFGVNKDLPFLNAMAYAQSNKLPILGNLKKSLQQLTAINIDNYIAIDLESLSKNEKLIFNLDGNTQDSQFVSHVEWCKNYILEQSGINSILKSLSFILNNPTKIYTSFNKNDYLLWLNQFSSNKSLQTLELGLNDAMPIKKAESIYYKPDGLNIDRELRDFFANSFIFKEQQRVEVYNASQIAGYSRQVQRGLEVYGVTITKIGNFPEPASSNIVYVKDINSARYTLDLIDQILDGNLLVTTEVYPYNSTADIVIVLAN